MADEFALNAKWTRLSADTVDLRAQAEDSMYSVQYMNNSNYALPIATYGSSGLGASAGPAHFGQFTPRGRAETNVDAKFHFNEGISTLTAQQLAANNKLRFSQATKQPLKGSNTFDYQMEPNVHIEMWHGEAAENATNVPQSSRVARRNKDAC